VVGWLVDHVELRPGFHELADAHRPTIVSSNFRQLIGPILEREGLELEVRANEIAWHPDGWRARFRNGEACGTCGEPCKRADLPTNGNVVYVGDWDGDGRDSVGVFDPATATFYLRNTNTTGVGEVSASFGNPNDWPIIGDWNGDHIDTIGVVHRS